MQSHITIFFFFFQAEDGIRDLTVTGVQTCALPICIEQLLHLARAAVVREQRQAQLRLRGSLVALQQVPQVAEPETQVRVTIVQLLRRKPGLVQPSRAGQHLSEADRPNLALRLGVEVRLRLHQAEREDRKSTRLNPVTVKSRMPSSA